MKICHNSITKKSDIEKYYSKKDGIDVAYVCTTELPNIDNIPVDIFYRVSPHPKFGNHYFGIFKRFSSYFITNADNVETLEFSMINKNDEYYYSRYRHDFVQVGDDFIDGGRAYTRTNGNIPITLFKLFGGKFNKIS